MKTIAKAVLFCLLAISLFIGLAAMKDNYNERLQRQRQSQFIEHTDGPAMRTAEKEARGMRYRIAAMIFSILKWIGYRGTLSMDNRVLNILSTEKLDIGGATEPNSVLHIQSSGNVGSIEQTPGKLCICEKGNTGKGNDFTLSIDPSAWRMGNPPKESELLDVRGSVSDTAKLSKGH